jgi:hypothetical protein
MEETLLSAVMPLASAIRTAVMQALKQGEKNAIIIKTDRSNAEVESDDFGSVH